MVRVEDREKLLHLAHEFLVECFNVPNHAEINKEDCPIIHYLLFLVCFVDPLN